jgi:hypothetical protein
MLLCRVLWARITGFEYIEKFFNSRPPNKRDENKNTGKPCGQSAGIQAGFLYDGGDMSAVVVSSINMHAGINRESRVAAGKFFHRR